MEDGHLVQLTADIVSAHVSNNRVAVQDVGDLVKRVFDSLATLGSEPAEPEPARKQPAVSIRSSVKPDYIVCLQCGRKQRTLRRHLMTAHDMTPAQYRAEFGLPASYPLTAPNYSERRREMAKAIGLGRKKGERPPARTKGMAAGKGGTGTGKSRGRGSR